MLVVGAQEEIDQTVSVRSRFAGDEGVKPLSAFVEQICKERNLCLNALANLAGVSPSTAYSMMKSNRRDISLITVKKFCDGLDMTLGEFFSTPEFDALEQEIW